MHLLLKNDSQYLKVFTLLIKLTHWHSEVNQDVNKCVLLLYIQLEVALNFGIFLRVYVVLNFLLEVKLFWLELGVSVNHKEDQLYTVGHPFELRGVSVALRFDTED